MSSEVSRRRALEVATLGAAGVVVGGLGTWRSVIVPARGSLAAEQDEVLGQPTVLSSRAGVLEVELTAASGAVVAGRRTRALAYNGTSPGPTLRVEPGDVLRVTLVNDLRDTTNLHTHGLHVSPEGNGDNVFQMVEPGVRRRYEYAIPADHPTGTFWYHPHHHGTVADQIYGGLFGALVVARPDEARATPERVLVVSDTTLTRDGEVVGATPQQRMAGREGELVLVNGQLSPRIDAVEGRPERWRVVNACTSRFLRLQLDEHRLGFLGYDGQALGEPDERDTVVLAPGNRADLVVRSRGEGRYTLRTLGYDRGGMGMMGRGSAGSSAETSLATMRVAGRTAAGPDAELSTPWPGPSDAATEDLRGVAVDGRRTVTFTFGMGMGMGMGGMRMGFDGREFDAERVDQRVRLGAVEEWTLDNPSPMDHPFHLHVWPMQVVDAQDSDPGGRPDWRDVVVVPAGGRTTVRIRFADFGGRTVYHCHILDHEDNGMMGTIDVTPGPARSGGG